MKISRIQIEMCMGIDESGKYIFPGRIDDRHARRINGFCHLGYFLTFYQYIGCVTAVCVNNGTVFD